MNNKIIGIIGGMGPEATALFYSKIIKATKAKVDQDHFRVIIDSNPKIPDRTSAILRNGGSPVSAIVETGKNLETLHVEVICIPCITSHFFIEEIQSELDVPVLNALEVLYKYIKNNYPQVKSIGILATTGTIKTGLFNKYFPDFDILYPDTNSQNNFVMEAIYGVHGIKAGSIDDYPIDLLKKAGADLVNSGAQILIAGCTEIGIVLNSKHVEVPLIDPMDVLAESVTKS